MSPRGIKNWYRVHKWTSLICTAFALMLCVTGLPLIFSHEIDHALGYSVSPPPMTDAERRADLDAIVAAAESRRDGQVAQFLVADPEEPDAWFVRLGESIDGPLAAFYTFDARTGAFLNEYPLTDGITHILLRLHLDMFAGLPGTLFLGAMGLLLVASLVSGVVLYAPYMRKLRFGTLRRGRARRLLWLDLHNLIGIVTLVWLLVVTVTGVMNTLAIPIFGQWQATELAEMTRTEEAVEPVERVASLDVVLAAARAAEPDKRLSFMAFPGNPFAGPQSFVAYMQGDSAVTSKLLKPVVIDARSAEVRASRELPWYVSALLLSQPLHFGDYGGMPLKILWALLDILAIVVLATGLLLWLRRDGKAAEARLRRAHGVTGEAAA